MYTNQSQLNRYVILKFKKYDDLISDILLGLIF